MNFLSLFLIIERDGVYDAKTHHMLSKSVYYPETQTPASHFFEDKTNMAGTCAPLTFTDALKTVGCTGTFNFKNTDVAKYFADHISDLIDAALFQGGRDLMETTNPSIMKCAHFDISSEENSKKAFIILSNGPSLIINALISDLTFFLKMTEILSHPNLSSIVVNRLATILNYIIMNNEQASLDSIGFLTMILKYIEETAVFDLFCTIFNDKDKLKPMQKLLATTDIDVFILNEFSSTEILSYEKKLNLTLLINYGLKCKRLRDSFTNRRILVHLISLMNTEDTLLLNSIWSSLALLMTKKMLNKVEIQKLFEDAFEIICGSFDTLHTYHISIFEFLTAIVDLKVLMFTENHKKQICQTFQSLFPKFPNSTNLMSSMFKFIRTSLHNRDFAQRILDGYIPFFIDEGMKKQRTAASANALVFLGDLDRMKTSSYMINKSLTSSQKYMTFYKSFFKDYLEKLPNPYGGTVTRYVKEGKFAEKASKKHSKKTKEL
ncbi:hypothetical protein TRFO_22293 [Tritrichomonas foetus]|uniref:Uncharacterized protein n=1 Tax=Tritrichomonas foetus TaxID=1144522 RepID=A0A1J4KDG9_9EUKA|nr:hypothetical protein TRFO_22293 [Tritrichomonas foetus]|eukprot:OHT08960.1 hypothetical protein TRFO_22293 [Tritrichomonas foetus]